MTEIPLFTECVIGYRQWKVADWVLAPAAIGNPWRPGINHARCQPLAGVVRFWVPNEMFSGQHKAPHSDCHCGLYAMHEPPEELFEDGVSTYVLGAVAAWGDLQVHHDGFRAEYAQIVALVDADVGDAGDLNGIAELYGVPLVPRDLLEMEAHRHGQPLPEAARPELPPAPEYPPLTGGSGGIYYYGPGPIVTTSNTTWTPKIPGYTQTPKASRRERRANRQGKHKPPRAPKNLRPPKGF